jgi:transcription antitermination factor NusG
LKKKEHFDGTKMAEHALNHESTHSASKPWYAVRVRSSSEMRVAAALQRRGFDPFVPTYVASRCYSDRIKKVMSALFPGYLFCYFTMEQRDPLLQCDGVESIVSFGNLPAEIPDSEIRAIQRVVESGQNSEPWPYLQTGDQVTVQFGSLKGITGCLLQTKGVDRLLLSVSLLQRSISVEIDRTWVRPLVHTGVHTGAQTKENCTAPPH